MAQAVGWEVTTAVFLSVFFAALVGLHCVRVFLELE